MVEKIKSTNANVVLCQKGIDDIIQHYLAKAGILTVRRIKESDMSKLAKATGSRIVGSINDLSENDLGLAKNVEEKLVEEDKWVFIEGCKNPKVGVGETKCSADGDRRLWRPVYASDLLPGTHIRRTRQVIW